MPSKSADLLQFIPSTGICSDVLLGIVYGAELKNHSEWCQQLMKLVVQAAQMAYWGNCTLR